MRSIERARDGGLEDVDLLVEVAAPILEGVTGSMLFRKSSTVLVGTSATELVEATGPAGSCDVDDDFCGLSFRDARTALRASSSALRCCSISARLGDDVVDSLALLVPGTKGAALAERDDTDSVCRGLEGALGDGGTIGAVGKGTKGSRPVTSRLAGSRRLSSTKT